MHPLDLGAAAKAAECSPGLLRRALTQPQLLSPLQWGAIEQAMGARPGWLGSGDLWGPGYAAALVQNTRGRVASAAMQQVRRDNLKRLCKEAKKWVVLSKVLGSPATLLSNLAAGDNRAFGPARARSIESKLELPEGWMDRDDPVPQDVAARLKNSEQAMHQTSKAAAPAPASVGQVLFGLPPLHQAVLLKYAELARSGALTESFAHGLMGKLLEQESAPV